MFEALLKFKRKQKQDWIQDLRAKDPDHIDAVVMLGFQNAQTEPQLLMTQRSWQLRTHAGEVALPGGKIDKGESALEALYREVYEEVGIQAKYLELLGTLPMVKSKYGLEVLPVVVSLGSDLAIDPNPAEIAEIFHFPLSNMLEEAPSKQLDFQEAGFAAYGYGHQGFKIWGLTAQILVQMVNRVYDRGYDEQLVKRLTA